MNHWTIIVLFSAPLITLCNVVNAGEFVRPAQTWNGQFNDAELLKAKPASNIITSQVEFAKLWKAWRGKEEVPKVDFRKQFVAVITSQGMPVSIIQIVLNDGNGSLVCAGGPNNLQIKGIWLQHRHLRERED